MFIRPFVRPEDSHGYCDVCDKLICPSCLKRAKKNGERCDPWERQMEKMERTYEFRKSAGLDWDPYIPLRRNLK